MTRARDPKLVILRRADTERDAPHSISGQERRKATFISERKPVTLPRISCLEEPFEED
jgi:hypothetical protein